jgi:hypothetical protein
MTRDSHLDRTTMGHATTEYGVTADEDESAAASARGPQELNRCQHSGFQAHPRLGNAGISTG